MKSAHPFSNRRTLAIISHPDAGKTTLTEKLLLYGGAIEEAGSVTARRDRRTTTSDWMELEKKRGISISSTVLQFDYGDHRVNLLDTPGHEDFSEDTYRVLTAVDSAIMVIDAGKGVEARTRKLFEICRSRGVPIFTFINKLDRPARPALELLDEVENVLGIAACPMNWPLGDGARFRGLIGRRDGDLHLYERIPGGSYRAPEHVVGLDSPRVAEQVDADLVARAAEELHLLEGAGAGFDAAAIDAGQLTPVYFGSAANNFGIQLLLDGLLELGPAPRGRRAGTKWIAPEAPEFSGFVFKIQANLNPRHRDRMAFVRVVSGRFERDMQVWHSGTATKIRLSNSQRLFAQERQTVDEAWAGDIVGLVGNHPFRIGDTLSSAEGVIYDEIPVFPPECFARVRALNTAQMKRFRAGLSQLVGEGVVQPYELAHAQGTVPLLGAVGPLQFEVLQYRLEAEYGAITQLEPMSWNLVRWILIDGKPAVTAKPPGSSVPSGSALARDPAGRWTILAEADWCLRALKNYQPDWSLVDLPPDTRSADAAPDPA